MCPDEKMFTGYLDNELDSEFRRIMDEHFSVCTACGNKKNNMLALRQLMKSDIQKIDLEKAQSRVWTRLMDKNSCLSSKNTRISGFILKAAIIAAILSIGFLTGKLFNTVNSGKLKVPVQTLQLKEQKLEEVTDYLYNRAGENTENNNSIIITEEELQQLVDLLSAHSGVMEVKISLPKEPDFSIIGKPEIIRTDRTKRGK